MMENKLIMIENIIKSCTAVKIIQYLMLEEKWILSNSISCSTGGVYEHYYDYNNFKDEHEYRIYKSSSPDSGIVISNMQQDHKTIFSLNTNFYHHNKNNVYDLIIYGSDTNRHSSDNRMIKNNHNFQYFQDSYNLDKMIIKYGHNISYALALNALCRDMDIDNFKMCPLKVKQFLNDCLGDNWYNYYKGIL